MNGASLQFAPTPSGALSLNTWYHLCVTHNGNGGTMFFYVNGVATDAGVAVTQAIGSNSQDLYFGRLNPSHGATGLEPDMVIDDLAIFDRQLSAAEVYEIANGPDSAPTVDTGAATDVDHVSATLNGEITDIGTDDPDERGFVWGTTTQSDPGDVAPASSGYDDSETETGTFIAEPFDYPLAGLTSSTTYYVRAYAHNSVGYSYGPEISFDTDDAPPFRFTNIGGVVFDPEDTQTIYAERLNDILERLEALEP